MTNIILMADSYKYSQFNQYPEGTELVYSYIESRGGKFDETVFFGLQAFIMKYLSSPITQDMIDEAEEIILAHGEPFNREGWEYILEAYAGYLPVIIKAVPEGTVVPTSNILVSIQNTDPRCYWLPSFLETALLRAVWYPTTVATNSREIKKVILDALVESGTPSDIMFKLHDFGDRGVSSEESAAIGGTAHLVNFMGSDTVPALIFARKYYNAQMAAYSVPAMEHSTVTSWGREHEADSYRNMFAKNARVGGIVSCVSDSYDIFNACEMWGTELKQMVLDSGAMLVVRPDSGDPVEVILHCLDILKEHFGVTVNEKGYQVLNNVRILQGDGININTIERILDEVTLEGYSADNLVFGQGGALLQMVNRDDQKFAMKCSAVKVNGEMRDVYKDPITDSGKRSKRGMLKLISNEGRLTTVRQEEVGEDILEEVFVCGKLLRHQSLDEIRNRAIV